MNHGKRVLSIFMTIISLAGIAMFMILPLYNPTIYGSLYKFIILSADAFEYSFTTGVWDKLWMIIIMIILCLVVIILFFIFLRAFVSIFTRNAKCKLFGKGIILLIIFGLQIFMSIGFTQITFPETFINFINSNEIIKGIVVVSTTSPVSYVVYLEVVIVIILFILEGFRRKNIKTNPDARPQEEISLSRFNTVSAAKSKKEETVESTQIEVKAIEVEHVPLNTTTQKIEVSQPLVIHDLNEDTDEEISISNSKFDGSVLGYIGIYLLYGFLAMISLGLAIPYAICKIASWYISHCTIDNRRLEFEASSLELFGKMLLWFFLTLVTLGIFSLWVPIKLIKWIVANIHFAD